MVQNEKRQGENQPDGPLGGIESKTIYPVGHPYHHDTIGSMNDLNASFAGGREELAPHLVWPEQCGTGIGW